MKKILFLISEESYFLSHRFNLAKAALKAGFEVAIATRIGTQSEKIRQAGIRVFPLSKFNRSSLNLKNQLHTLIEFYKIYKIYKPDIVHHVAIKPVVYGSLIAKFCGVPLIINALGGLGYLFIDTGNIFSKSKKWLIRSLVLLVFRFAFSQKNSTLILQNKDDLETLVQFGCVKPEKVKIIRGAGVDLNAFPVLPWPDFPPIKIACVCRMLKDKGIVELAEAAATLKKAAPEATVLLYGTPDPTNPTSISEQQLTAWHHAKLIDWKGHCSDVAKAYADCHIAVLASYREGLPKSLLEAASCGRPIVTTDVPGCREVVVDGQNGFLVPAKNSVKLAEALLTLIQDEALRVRMGVESRRLAEEHFSDEVINRETLALYNGNPPV